MAKGETLKLAQEIAKALEKDPALTVDQLAEQFDSTHDEVVAILDEHLVVDGKVSHEGPGKGGGWVATGEA